MRHERHLDQTSDEVLLARYAKGEAAAASILSARVVPRILALATRLLAGDRAEAEDIAQEAMLRLWRIAPEWRTGEAQITTWLYRVTVNLCTDRYRKGRTTPLDGIAEPADKQKGALAQMQDAERLSALDQALATLPDRQRQAVVLRHIEGFSNPEIAEILETGVEAVESLTARGKRALKSALLGRREELGYQDD